MSIPEHQQALAAFSQENAASYAKQARDAMFVAARAIMPSVAANYRAHAVKMQHRAAHHYARARQLMGAPE